MNYNKNAKPPVQKGSIVYTIAPIKGHTGVVEIEVLRVSGKGEKWKAVAKTKSGKITKYKFGSGEWRRTVFRIPQNAEKYLPKRERMMQLASMGKPKRRIKIWPFILAAVIALILWALISSITSCVAEDLGLDGSSIDDMPSIKFASQIQLSNREKTISLKCTPDIFESIRNNSEWIEKLKTRDEKWEYCNDTAIKSYETRFDEKENMIYIDMEYVYSDEELDFIDSQMEKVLKGISHFGMPKREKAEAIYQYVINIGEYEERAPEGVYPTVYRLLVEEKATSAAYSKLYYDLLQKAGINARIVTGSIVNETGEEDNSHIWVLAEIDRRWGHCDPALDAHSSGANLEQPEYYLAEDESMINANFQWDTKIYPDTSVPPTFVERVRSGILNLLGALAIEGLAVLFIVILIFLGPTIIIIKRRR